MVAAMFAGLDAIDVNRHVAWIDVHGSGKLHVVQASHSMVPQTHLKAARSCGQEVEDEHD